MNNKILIGLISFLIIAIIAVAGVLVYVKNNDTSTSNTTNQQSYTSVDTPSEVTQNTETQLQNTTTENIVSQNNIKTENEIIYQNTFYFDFGSKKIRIYDNGNVYEDMEIENPNHQENYEFIKTIDEESLLNLKNKIKNNSSKTELEELVKQLVYGTTNLDIGQKMLNTENTINSKKILIAYFSRPDENYTVGTVSVGNTEIMAGYIKDYLGQKADTFKIDPVVSYPANYKECTEVATREKNSNARPEFKNANNLNMNNYETIFIGYPIWWGDVPMIVNTFLEKYNFSGKTIIPFNTHEGSGNAGTYVRIKNKMLSSNVNTNGLAIRGATVRQESSRSTVQNWLEGLGY